MNLLKLLLWGPMHFVVVRLPYATAMRLGRLIGLVAHGLMGSRRQLMQAELARLFPTATPTELHARVRDSFAQQGMAELENTLHGTFTPANINDRIRVQGLDRLDASLKKGKGVLLATFHFGAHLQVMLALGHRGYAVNQVAFAWNAAVLGKTGRPLRDMVAGWLHRARRKHSADTLPANIIPLSPDSSVRPVIRCLQQNQIVILAVDGRHIGRLEAFRFLGREAYSFSPGVGELALRLGVSVHPIFMIRDADLRNTLVIEEAIAADPSTAPTGRDYTALLVGRLEQQVRQHPDHYGMEVLFERRRQIREQQQGAEGGPGRP